LRRVEADGAIAQDIEVVRMGAAPPLPPFAWLALVFVSIANFGNFYVYDSIGPVADLLVRNRGFSDTQIGLLNAIYSLPNILLLLVGGWLVDRFGAGRMMAATAVCCLMGALLTALGADFRSMAAGRLLFGVGAETFNVATLAGVVRFFSARYLALAIGISLALGRAGAFAVDLSPTWLSSAYADGWQSPLLVAAAFAGVSLLASIAYWQTESSRATPASVPALRASLYNWHDFARFRTAFWYLFALCVVWYAVVFAFRSTFSIKYFQHAHGLDLAAAGAINGYIYLAALFATPLLGWLSDRTQRPTPLLAAGCLLLPASIAVIATNIWPLWVGTILIGTSYSLVPAVLWSLASRLVPEMRLGVALSFLSVGLNIGIAGANVAAGQLNDRFGAGASNPAGYKPMMLLFFALGMLGFIFSLMLWKKCDTKARRDGSLRRLHT
jgi:MFS family permease